MKALALKMLGWRARMSRKNRSVKRKNIPYSESKKIGILFSVEDIFKHEAVKHLIQLLEKDEKEIVALCYLGDSKENFEFRFDYFSLDHLSLTGQITAENVHNFMDTPFDFLYHLDTGEVNPMLYHILSGSKALCRVGIHKPGKEHYYELMLRPTSEKDLNTIVEEFYHYTKALN